MIEIVIRFVAGIVLILANAFFVMAEFALTRARQYDREEFQGHPGLRKAWEMTDRMEIHLTGCQLGISSTSVLLGIVFEPAVTELIRPVVELFGIGGGATTAISITISVVIINLVHKIWGEQAPTYWGIEQPKRVLALTAIPLSWWTRVTYPLIKLGDGLAKATLGLFGIEMTRSWAEEEAEGVEGENDAEAESGGGSERRAGDGPRTELKRGLSDLLRRQNLPPDRRQEIVGALEIDERPVRDIMVPRDAITALSTELSFDENARRIGESSHSRYPLVGASVDDFRGVLYLPEIFRNLDALKRGDLVLDDLDHSDLRVPADLPISEFIDRLQEAGEEMALVVAPDGEEDAGRVLGLATQTNAVESVFGELRDPLDEETEDRGGAERDRTAAEPA